MSLNLSAPVAAIACADSAEIAAGPPCWGITARPAATAQATATKAAGSAGVRHICNTIVASLACGATAQGPLQLVVRDGASGVGTIIFQIDVSCPANQCWVVELTDLGIVGSAATAMTIEFTGASAAASQQSVNLYGFDVTGG